jgi:hypothetical protein
LSVADLLLKRLVKNCKQRTRLGDGGVLSWVTLGCLPLNGDKKVEFKLLLFG